MEPVIWTQIATTAGTLVTAFLGFLLSGVNDRRKDQRAADQERLKRREEAQRVAAIERHKDQLETLLALQDDVQQVARNAARSLHHDHMTAREGLPASQLPEGLSEDDYTSRVSLSRHASRVLDDRVREAAVSMASELAALTLMPVVSEGSTRDEVENEAFRRLRRLNEIVTPTMALMGEAVRAEMLWTPAADA